MIYKIEIELQILILSSYLYPYNHQKHPIITIKNIGSENLRCHDQYAKSFVRGILIKAQKSAKTLF